MTDTSVYVTKPSLPPLEDFLPYLAGIWDSRLLTNGGPFHTQFERDLEAFLGVPHVSLFANGTLALLTALQVLGVRGEVITTPYSFVATSHALLWNGLRPVFVDIDANSLNLDPARIGEALTQDTTALLPVHCYGRPCDVDRLQDIADNHGLKLVYDAAHAFGIDYDRASILNRGDLSVLSFHATKVLNTFEGGAIVCRDAETKAHVDHLKNFGFTDEVTVEAPGINGKMSEFNAALGCLQLRHVSAAIEARRRIDAHYRSRLGGVTGLSCLAPSGRATQNHNYFPVLIDDGFPISRDESYLGLKKLGINARRYFYPLISEFPMYRDLPSAHPGNLPVATRIARQVLCLPIYPDLPPSTVDRICDFLASPV